MSSLENPAHENNTVLSLDISLYGVIGFELPAAYVATLKVASDIVLLLLYVTMFSFTAASREVHGYEDVYVITPLCN